MLIILPFIKYHIQADLKLLGLLKKGSLSDPEVSALSVNMSHIYVQHTKIIKTNEISEV